jgi:uncharacterized membrane protein
MATMTTRSPQFLTLLVSAVAVSGYALWGYGSGMQRAAVHPDMIRVFNAQRTLITLHATCAGIALVSGPLQFLPGLRARRPSLHRWLGYLYLTVGVGIGGVSGLLLAFTAYGGLVSAAGFSLLAALWLFTGVHALLAAKQKDFKLHRIWMIRNYALTFAGVTIRIYLGLFFASGLKFEEFYSLLAWLCWVPNLILVEWWLLPGRNRQNP